MLKITKPRRIETVTLHHRQFTYRGSTHGHGFAFPSDERGNVDLDALRPNARENYEKCISGELDVIDGGVEHFEHINKEPAEGRCPCGGIVFLTGFTNSCDCGRDYNSAGQELAPRSQWGEETGEHPADILRIR